MSQVVLSPSYNEMKTYCRLEYHCDTVESQLDRLAPIFDSSLSWLARFIPDSFAEFLGITKREHSVGIDSVTGGYGDAHQNSSN